ncbi:DUF1853 family protein [Photobacterium sagamiensis]|uniref:DUF1853 family protein n=1 Tax=Photobacterium sagamiensis TaxID=2910241 RepID=UPI003D10C835
MSFAYNNATNHQQYENNIKAVLHCPTLTLNTPYQVDEAWFAHFRENALIPEVTPYQGNRRLGFYYQWLWQQIIEAHPHYQLVAEEIQLHWQNRTLGAIDFFVLNRQTNQLEHWEVAIKFYLAYQRQWLGPNAADRLDKKIGRMVEHQLMLCEHPAYKEQLQGIYGQPKVKRLIMQGRLFSSHCGHEQGSDIAINPNVLTGRWCFRSQLKEIQAEEMPLKLLNKPQWLAPPRYDQLSKPLDINGLSTPTQALSADNQVWFVVPDHWPAELKHSKNLHA